MGWSQGFGEMGAQNLGAVPHLPLLGGGFQPLALMIKQSPLKCIHSRPCLECKCCISENGSIIKRKGTSLFSVTSTGP